MSDSINSPRTIILDFIKASKGTQKAGAKYYKREWGNDRWKYWYTKESYDRDKAEKKTPTAKEPSLFDKIAGFFGIESDKAKTIPKAEYETHGIKDKGISLSEWTSHFAKYFQRKAEFDAKFGQEKLAKDTNSEIIDTNQPSPTESIKTADPIPEGKTVYKKSIFRTLFELYGDKNGINSNTGGTLPGNSETGLSSTKELSGSMDLRESSGNLSVGRQENQLGESPTVLGNSEPGLGNDVLGSERLNTENIKPIVKIGEATKDGSWTQAVSKETLVSVKTRVINAINSKIEWAREKVSDAQAFIDQGRKGYEGELKKYEKMLSYYQDKLTESEILYPGEQDYGFLNIKGHDTTTNPSITKNAILDEMESLGVKPDKETLGLGISLLLEKLESIKNRSQAMLGNQNAKKAFSLEQESVPEPKGFQKENNLFGITPQTEGKFLNQATKPPLLNKNIKSLSDFVSSVKDSLLSEGLDKKAEQWVHDAYKKGDSNFSELIEKSKEFVTLSDADETSLKSQIKGNPTVEKQEQLDKNLETTKEKFSQKKQFEITTLSMFDAPTQTVVPDH